MIPEIGLFCLIVACALACLHAGTLAFSALRLTGRHALLLPGLQLALCAVAMALLIAGRMVSDFTMLTVAEHSNRSLPLLYKIAGAWGNHEGSLLLIVLVLALFSAILHRRNSLATQRAGAVMAALIAAFLLFTLLTSNPFARVFPPPPDGGALNPLLQDIALALHPPMLYLGYIGFSAVYALAVAALLRGDMGRDWARHARPWILWAWSALTLGIGLGSWWAYRELGWGGYWFWDPVENASLLPWLAGTALLHANLALERRDVYAPWVLLLAILTFAMTLVGIFLVRSGAVTSVHSFASDPARGTGILLCFIVFIGGALALFAARAGHIRSEAHAVPVSREGMILFNSLLVVTALVTVLIGTLYPLAAEWLLGAKLSVGAPYFHRTFVPIMAGALLLAAIAPHMAWRQESYARIGRMLAAPLLAAAGVLAVAAAAFVPAATASVLGMALAAWLAAGTLRYALSPSSATKSRKYATVTAHLGAAVLVVGIAGMAGWKAEHEQTLRPGEHFMAAGHRFTLEKVISTRRANHMSRQAHLTVQPMKSAHAFAMAPEHRMYDIRGVATTEAFIVPRWWGDLYAVAGEPGEGRISLHVHFNTLSHLLWAGCLMIALGGAMAARRTEKG